MTENETWLLAYLIGIPLSFAGMMAVMLSAPGKVPKRQILAVAFGSLLWPLFLFFWLLP